MGKDVIIACDFSSKDDVMAFLDKFTDVKPFVKIGMELYYAEGPSIVKKSKQEVTRFSLTLNFMIFQTQLKSRWLYFLISMLI